MQCTFLESLTTNICQLVPTSASWWWKEPPSRSIPCSKGHKEVGRLGGAAGSITGSWA